MEGVRGKLGLEEEAGRKLREEVKEAGVQL